MAESSGSQGWLLAGTALAGPAFGTIWPMMVVLSSELFGSRKLSQNYMIFDGCAGAIGTVCLGNFLVSFVYDQAPTNSDGNCVGEACFGPAHLCICALAVLATVSALTLSFTNLGLY